MRVRGLPGASPPETRQRPLSSHTNWRGAGTLKSLPRVPASPGAAACLCTNVGLSCNTVFQQALGASLAVTSSTRNSVRGSSSPRPRQPGAAGPSSSARGDTAEALPGTRRQMCAGHPRWPRRRPTGVRWCAADSFCEAAPGSLRLTPYRARAALCSLRSLADALHGWCSQIVTTTRRASHCRHSQTSASVTGTRTPARTTSTSPPRSRTSSIE